MNIFNRILAVLVGLLLSIGAVVALLAALGIPEVQAFGTPWIQDGLRRLAQPDVRALSIALSLLALLVGLLLLVLELRLPQREPAAMALKQDELGRVTVTKKGVRELVDREAGRIEGVSRVHSQVTQDRNGLRILCRLSVEPTANVPALAEQVRQRIKASVEHHLGQPVAEVGVQTQLAPANGGRRVR